jgi:hypothetical protein
MRYLFGAAENQSQPLRFYRRSKGACRAVGRRVRPAVI